MYCLLVTQCCCAAVDHCTLCQMCQAMLAIVMFGKWQATMIGSWSVRNSFFIFQCCPDEWHNQCLGSWVRWIYPCHVVFVHNILHHMYSVWYWYVQTYIYIYLDLLRLQLAFIALCSWWSSWWQSWWTRWKWTWWTWWFTQSWRVPVRRVGFHLLAWRPWKDCGGRMSCDPSHV